MCLAGVLLASVLFVNPGEKILGSLLFGVFCLFSLFLDFVRHIFGRFSFPLLFLLLLFSRARFPTFPLFSHVLAFILCLKLDHTRVISKYFCAFDVFLIFPLSLSLSLSLSL